MKDIFHEGERLVQEQAGVRSMAKRVGNGIHDRMPPIAEEFLSRQPFAVVSMADTQGRTWASLVTGDPGFLKVLDDQTVLVNALPPVNDPLYTILIGEVEGEKRDIGMLVIELEPRRRMRINGIVASESGGFTIQVRQAYANCPKYIQAREITQETGKEATPVDVQRGSTLSQVQQQWIAGTDTFFIASRHPQAGADASHRGGNPGFVHLLDARTLRFPDYSGNTMFNTLGNLAVNPSAGLLFVDFQTGKTLQLTGEARILWEEELLDDYPGAERLVEFVLAEAIETSGAFPLRGELLSYSPFNPD